MITIAELAATLGLPVDGDVNLTVSRVRSLRSAGSDDLSFVNDERFQSQALASPVRALLARPDLKLPGKTVIQTPNPLLAVVKIIPILHPQPQQKAGIDPRAVIGQDCRIAMTACIHALAVLGARVRVAERSEIGPGVVLGDDVVIGEDAVIHANVTVGCGCCIGDRVIVHAGTVIGSDGYGYVQNEGRHVKIPQLGNVVIEDDVEIGANNTIDRATFDSTIIRHGTKTDNLVHIAHNVEIGEHSLILGQVGFAGSTKVGAYFTISGQSGVADHLDVPDRVTVGPGSLLTRPGRTGETYYGYPARPVKEWKRSISLFNSLHRLAKRRDHN